MARAAYGFCFVFAALVLAAMSAAPALADKITVTQYGRVVNSLPYAVALKKGFFKDEGLDIDGIIASQGGGTSLRNMMASDLPFGEAALPAVLAAIRSGMHLKIVFGGGNSIGELTWVSPIKLGIKSIKDLVGKKVAYTSPRSTTEMILRMALEKEGVPADKVDLIAAGGIGPGLTALANGGVDAAPMVYPKLASAEGKYNFVIVANDLFPRISWDVGVTTTEFAKKHPDKVRALINARIKAVDWMYKNLDGTAKIYAEVWHMDPALAKKILPKFYAIKYWPRGEFDKEGLEVMLRGMKIVGELKKPVDLNAVIDQSFLPADLRTKL